MGAIYSFLSQIDPNWLIAVAGGVLTVGRWLAAKVRGEKTASAKDALWPIVEGLVVKLAESEFVVEKVRAALEKGAYEGLGRLGIKRSPMIEGIVAELVERGVSEVRKRVANRKAAQELPAQLESLAKAAEAVKAATVAKPGEVPVLGYTVEYVKPAGQ